MSFSTCDLRHTISRSNEITSYRQTIPAIAIKHSVQLQASRMHYNELSTIVMSVLASISHQSEEIMLINRLNKVFNFDHNIQLIDSSLDLNRFIDGGNQRESVPTSFYTFGSSVDNIDGLNGLTRIESKNTLLIVALEEFPFGFSSKMQRRLVEIQRMQRNMKIGIFVSRRFSRQNVVQNIFYWCWTHGIINIFVATFPTQCASNVSPFLHIFKFDPYGISRVINITGHDAFEQLYLDRKVNFQQYPLRFPPVSIMAQEIRNIFCSGMNASQSTAIGLNGVDIGPSANTFSTFSPSNNSYPVTGETFVILVPDALPYPQFGSYLQSTISGRTLGWYSIVIVAIILLLTLIRYKKRNKIEFTQCTIDVVNLLMNDNTSIRYQTLSCAEVAIFVPLTIAGLFTINGVSSALQSYITQPCMQPEIDTIEELYNSALPILLTHEPFKAKLVDILTNRLDRNDWSDKIYLTTATEIQRYISLGNFSMSFLASDRHAKIMLENGKQSSARGYRIPIEAGDLVKMWTTFYVNENFPFLDRVTEISHWLHTAGIYQRWDRAKKHDELKALDRANVTAVDTFPVPMFIYYGWIVGGIVFCMEILWNFVNHQRSLKSQ